ncbi:hypothetical protein CHS0354_035961, partial [Potamilus streckersoni]
MEESSEHADSPNILSRSPSSSHLLHADRGERVKVPQGLELRPSQVISDLGVWSTASFSAGQEFGPQDGNLTDPAKDASSVSE